VFQGSLKPEYRFSRTKIPRLILCPSETRTLICNCFVFSKSEETLKNGLLVTADALQGARFSLDVDRTCHGHLFMIPPIIVPAMPIIMPPIPQILAHPDAKSFSRNCFLRFVRYGKFKERHHIEVMISKERRARFARIRVT
jgi:hypothetical protein